MHCVHAWLWCRNGWARPLKEFEPVVLIILLAYLGGILTILSPCILPVLPFVFARADRSFVRSTLPLLAGMAATFAIVATLAAVGGGWAIKANAVGRWAALICWRCSGLRWFSRASRSA